MGYAPILRLAETVTCNYEKKAMNWKLIIQIWILFIGQSAICQNEEFKFTANTKSADYYLLKGTIDNKYKITMKLHVRNSARCGEKGLAIQWKNGGIDGWYSYDKYNEKIEILGSYLNDNEVRLFVPNSSEDTINDLTCEMENYKETFWNLEDFDLTKMNWKMKNSNKPKPVELSIIHEPVPDTLILTFEKSGEIAQTINISKLIKKPELDEIEVISYSKFEDKYHLLFTLENFGWREYQSYLGYLSINENMKLENFEVLLSYDSWKSEEENLIFDKKHPEKGIKKIE